MASKTTLTMHLQGTSDLKGAIGPRDFAVDFSSNPQAFDDELMAVVTPSNTSPSSGVTIAIPPMTSMGMLLIVCDLQLQFQLNSEAVTRTLTPPAAGSKGVYMQTGGPVVTSITFFGTNLSSPKSTAYIFVTGN